MFDLKEEVPEEPYVYPFGKAAVVQQGSDITLAAVSYLVEEAKKAAALLKRDGMVAEVIDIVSSNPIDYDTICASVRKTNRLVVLDISWEPFGLASQVSAEVSGRLLKELKGPVERITLPFFSTPTTSALESAYYPTADSIYKRCKVLFKKTE